MKRELTARENLLIVEALKALIQDTKAEIKMHNANNYSRTSQRFWDKLVEVNYLRNTILSKDCKLYIETP